MITLRCTRKLLDRLGVPTRASGFDAPTNALGDWYANLLRIGHEQLVIATSERSLLTVIFPARELRHRLVPSLCEKLAMLLRELDVPEEVISRELAAMEPVAFAPTASRSVLASMNQFAMHCEWMVRSDIPPVEAMLRLARTPMTALKEGVHDCGYPDETARRLLGLEGRRPPPKRLVRLRITLLHVSPTVWREVIVPENIRLTDLHDVLQIAMGWTNSHLHEFVAGDTRYGMPDPEWSEPVPPKDERLFKLADLLREHRAPTFLYLYDFGDGWEHEVTVEEAFDNDGRITAPTCTQGENACPPEDVGGPPGYFDFLEAIRDRAHPDHEAMLDWAGGNFDPSRFDRLGVERLLRGRFRG